MRQCDRLTKQSLTVCTFTFRNVAMRITLTYVRNGIVTQSQSSMHVGWHVGVNCHPTYMDCHNKSIAHVFWVAFWCQFCLFRGLVGCQNVHQIDTGTSVGSHRSPRRPPERPGVPFGSIWGSFWGQFWATFGTKMLPESMSKKL